MNESKRVVLWVLGEPGIGKTTMVRALFGDAPLRFVESPKWTLAGDRIALAGHYKGTTFDGGDTVPYNAAEAAQEYWRDELSSFQLTILDGDRFSHEGSKSLFEAHALGLAVLLEAPLEVAAGRRKSRGSNQSESWISGRRTKSRRFFDSFHANRGLKLDGTLPTKDLAKAVENFILLGDSGRKEEEGALGMFG